MEAWRPSRADPSGCARMPPPPDAQACEAVSMGVGLVGEGGQDVEGAGYGRSQVPQAQQDRRGASPPLQQPPPQPHALQACAHPVAAGLGGRCGA